MSRKSIDARQSRVYHPDGKELQRLSRLHSTLTRIAVDKKQGNISPDKAIDKATAATAKLVTAEQLKKINNALPVTRIWTLCNNGWIREAADSMLVTFPGLKKKWQSS